MASDEHLLWTTEQALTAVEAFLATPEGRGFQEVFAQIRNDLDDRAAFERDDLRRQQTQSAVAQKWWESVRQVVEQHIVLFLTLAEPLAQYGIPLDDLYTVVPRQFHSEALKQAYANIRGRFLQGELPPGITNTRGWSDTQLREKLVEVKGRLDWVKTTDDARKWWESFEIENAQHLDLVLRLAEELAIRKATVTEFFLAYSYSRTDNIQANLCYLDFTRLKQEERKKKAAAQEVGAEPLAEEFLSSGFPAPTSELPPGITNTRGWSDTQLREKLVEVKGRLDWVKTTDDARKWWESFEIENAQRLDLVLRLAEELAIRKATVTEFFLAYVYSSTDNIQANLSYMDYTRLKKEEDRKKKEAAAKAKEEAKKSEQERRAARAAEGASFAAAYFRNRTPTVPDAKSLDFLPVVTRLAVEVALDLLGGDNSPDINTLTESLFPQMRERIREDTGVTVPGVRLRGNDIGMPKDSYLIMINEIPLVMGSASRDKVFMRGTHGQPSKRSWRYSSTAAAAHFPPQGDWCEPERAGGRDPTDVWDHLEYLTRHIEFVVRLNLVQFFGLQDVDNTLVRWLETGLSPDAAQHIRTVRQDYGLLWRTTRQLQGLLQDRVLLTQPARVVAGLQASHQIENPVECRRILREALREQLWGNDGTYTHFRLSDSIEVMLGAKSVRPDRFSVTREDLQEFFSAVRTEISSEGMQPALVTRGERLRYFVRYLIREEWPEVPVLADGDLVAPLTYDSLPVISLE